MRDCCCCCCCFCTRHDTHDSSRAAVAVWRLFAPANQPRRVQSIHIDLWLLHDKEQRRWWRRRLTLIPPPLLLLLILIWTCCCSHYTATDQLPTTNYYGVIDYLSHRRHWRRRPHHGLQQLFIREELTFCCGVAIQFFANKNRLVYVCCSVLLLIAQWNSMQCHLHCQVWGPSSTLCSKPCANCSKWWHWSSSASASWPCSPCRCLWASCGTSASASGTPTSPTTTGTRMLKPSLYSFFLWRHPFHPSSSFDGEMENGETSFDFIDHIPCLPCLSDFIAPSSSSSKGQQVRNYTLLIVIAKLQLLHTYTCTPSTHSLTHLNKQTSCSLDD